MSLTGGTASFANATVGAGKTVTLTGATLTGSAAGNYNLTSVGTTTASITALGITGSFTAADKVYDGTTSATVLTRTLTGVLAADTANVSLTGGTASFGDCDRGCRQDGDVDGSDNHWHGGGQLQSEFGGHDDRIHHGAGDHG